MVVGGVEGRWKEKRVNKAAVSRRRHGAPPGLEDHSASHIDAHNFESGQDGRAHSGLQGTFRTTGPAKLMSCNDKSLFSSGSCVSLNLEKL